MNAGAKSFTTVDEYIRALPPPVRRKLEAIRKLVRNLAPDATEKISYKMPAFHLNGNLLYYAAFRNHIGLFPTPSGVHAFEKELSEYTHSKGSIRFPLDEDLPMKLIGKIVRHRIKECSLKGAAKNGGHKAGV
jgi:uncharacterized protein YdhG (YjbR/CyaY superfamily)